jgi:predicted nucleic acid-binding protein
MRPKPEERVLRWLDQQPRASIWTTSVTVFEIRFGLETMPAGKRRTSFMASFERWLAEVVEQRIAGYDETAARRSPESCLPSTQNSPRATSSTSRRLRRRWSIPGHLRYGQTLADRSQKSFVIPGEYFAGIMKSLLGEVRGSHLRKSRYGASNHSSRLRRWPPASAYHCQSSSRLRTCTSIPGFTSLIP